MDITGPKIGDRLIIHSYKIGRFIFDINLHELRLDARLDKFGIKIDAFF
jgi:hypothetical protein